MYFGYIYLAAGRTLIMVPRSTMTNYGVNIQMENPETAPFPCQDDAAKVTPHS